MAKIPDSIKISVNTDEIEKKIQETVKEYENNIIEKIAFSLFIMNYFKHEFIPGESDLYYKVHILKEREMWKSGNQKNRLKFFFDLAEKIYKTNLNNKDKCSKENSVFMNCSKPRETSSI